MFWKPHYSEEIDSVNFCVICKKTRTKVRTALNEITLSEDPLYTDMHTLIFLPIVFFAGCSKGGNDQTELWKNEKRFRFFIRHISKTFLQMHFIKKRNRFSFFQSSLLSSPPLEIFSINPFSLVFSMLAFSVNLFGHFLCRIFQRWRRPNRTLEEWEAILSLYKTHL